MSYLEELRRRVGPQKIILVYSTACVVDDEGRILMQCRGDFGWWGLPGGMLEPGESLAECTRREVLEETGLEIRVTRLIGVYSSPDFDLTYPNGDQVQQVSFCFLCQPISGSLQPDGSETLETNWFELIQRPATSHWYEAMLSDLAAGIPATFDRGRAGEIVESSPTVQHMRHFLGKDPFILPGTRAFVLNSGGKILLERRINSGLWCLPGGGMELGERLDHAVEREVLEETGLRVQAEKLLAVHARRSPVIFPNGDELYTVLSLFQCRLLDGELRADPHESSEVGFFSPNELPTLEPGQEQWISLGLNPRPETWFE